MANRIQYDVDFNVQKKSLQSLKTSLQEIKRLTSSDLMKINNSSLQEATKSLLKIKEETINVESALKQAFNAKLNTVNIDTFNNALKKSGTSLNQIYNEFSKAGSVGQAAFRDLSNSVLDVNLQLRQTHPLLDKMATTLANTVKWQAASSAVNMMTRAVQQAWGFTKSLDTTLNDIRIVTGKTAQQMGNFATKANKAAQELGKTTNDYTKASLIYAQQGLSDEEIQARTAITLKTANVTGQSASQVSEQLTAVWNGYKVNAEQAQLYVDRLAAIAATTASDLEELSTGMSKVASAAATLGVGEDQLAAQLSTIISVTKQAPESVGTALRTVYARISDIKAGISEDDVDLGRYSGKMAELGFNVLDATGNLRDMGSVIEEIGGRWNDLTREQQISLAQTMAGQRQYSNLIALFDNFEEYNKAMEVAANSAGTLQQQQSIYMESIAAHLNTLSAAVQNIYKSLFDDTDSINGLLDGLKNAANLVSQFVQSIGGGVGVLRTLGAVGMSVFSDQIARGITTMITNFQSAKANAMELQASIDTISKLQQNSNLDIDTQRSLQSRKALLQNINIIPKQAYDQGRQRIIDTDEALKELAILSDQKKEIDDLIQKWGEYADVKKSVDEIYDDEKSKQSIIESLYALDELKSSYDDLKDKISNLDPESENFKQDWMDIELQIEKILPEFEKFKNTGLLNENEIAEFDKLKIIIQDLKNDFRETDSNEDLFFSSSDEDGQKLIATYTQLKQILDSLYKRSDSVSENLNHQQGSIKNQYDKKLEEAQIKIEKENEQNRQIALAARIKQYTNLASGIARVGTTIKQVQRIGNIWNDKDLSFSEKMLQTITNTATTFPMFVSGLHSISTAMGMTTAATAALGGAFGALMVAMTAISGINQKIQSTIQQHQENIEKEVKIQQELENNEQLYKSLQQLDEKYQNNEITRSQLKSAVEDLVEQYGLEKEAVDLLKGSYDNLTEASKTLQQQDRERLKQSLNNTKIQLEQAAMSTARSNIDDSNFNKNGFFYQTISTNQNDVDNIFKYITPQSFYKTDSNGNTFFQQTLGTGQFSNPLDILKNLVTGAGGLQFSTSGTDIEALSELTDYFNGIIDDIQTAVKNGNITADQLNNSELYKGLQNFVQKISPLIEQYKTVNEDLNAIQDAQAIENQTNEDNEIIGFNDYSNIQSLSQYTEALSQATQDLIDKQGYDWQTARQKARQYFKNYQSEIYNQFDELYNLEKQFEKRGFSKDEAINFIDQNILNWNDENINFLLDNINNLPINDLETFMIILQKIAQLDFSNVSEGLSVDKIKQDKQAASDRYVLLQSLQDQISSGKSISKSEFKNISEQVPQGNWDQYFTMQANGTYKMTQDAETFYNTVNSLKLDGFFSTIDNLQQQMSRLQSVARTTSAGDKYNGWKDFSSPATIRGADDQLTISPFGYDKVKDQLEYLDLVIDSNSELGKQIQQWKSLAEIQNLSVEDMQDISDLMKQVGDQTGNFKGVYNYLKEQTKELQHQIHDAMFPTDADIDQTALAQLTDVIEEMAPISEDLANSLQEDQRAAEDVAEAILRFDDAIQDVVKNYDDWLAALESGTAQQQAEVIEDLRDAYADLLDLDGDSLSDSFLTSTENLELMKAAIDGDIDAYDELMSRAGQDIIAQLTLDKTQFENDLNVVQNELDAMNFQDLQIGANLDTGNFLQACTDLVNNANMTAKQATDYLASMGVDAQVIEEKDSDTETKQITGFHPEDNSTSIPYSFPYMIGEGGIGFHEGNMIVPGVTYVPDTETVNDMKENAAFSLRVISANKSSGGNFKFSQSKNGGGTGGQKRRSGGGGGKGKSCFVAGTLISTQQGFKNIEDIEIGDIVLSYNLEIKRNEYSKVLQTMIHDTTEEIYSIHVQNDIIQSTGIHKFLIVRNHRVDWIPASDLKVNDLVRFSNGTLHRITKIYIQIKTLTVYNFEVSNNHNYYVGQNGILVHNKGGKGGGGKGSEPDKTQKDLKKAIEDERDLYHDINIQIEKINRNLDRTQKKQDRLYGEQLLKNLNKQTQILKQHNLKLQQKQDLQQQDLKSQQQTLKNLGVTFDQYGNISNYMDILGTKQSEINKLIEEENNLIQAYNESTDKQMKQSINQEITAADKKVKEAQDAYKQIEDKIKNYDQLREDMEDLVDDIEENLQQQIEIEIQKFRMEVEIRLQMGEAERDWNKFRRQVLEHNSILKDSDFDNLMGDTRQNLNDLYSYFNVHGSIGSIQKLTDQLRETRNQIEAIDKTGTSAIYGDNKAQAMQDLQNDLKELMSQMEDIESLIDDINKAYLDTIDDVSDNFDKQIEDYQFVNDLLEHDMDLLELLYGDKNYEAMDRYYTKLQQNNNKQLDSLRKQSDFWKTEWQAAVARGDTNAAEKFKKNYQDTIKDLNSLIEDSVKLLQQKYENAINGIFDTLDKKLTGGKGIDYLSTEWDLMNKNADEYLDTINSAFAIQQAQRKYQKALDETKSIKNQQSLKKLMDEQLNILKTKEKLTQYDVDRAEKLLQVEQARIALEQSQSSKTSMRLKRDSQGNYSYEYVADKGSVEDAQAELAAAQNDLYNFDKDRYQSNLDDILSAWKDFQSDYKEIILDMSLTEAERVEKLALLREQYGEYINNKTEENLHIRANLTESAFADLAVLYETDVENYRQMTATEQDALMNQLVPAWGSGVQAISDTIAGEGGLLNACQDAFNDIRNVTKDYQNSLDELAQTAGVDFRDIQNGIDETANQMQLLIMDNQELLSLMQQQMTAMGQLQAQALALAADYKLVYQSAKDAATAIHNFIQEQQRAAAGASGGSSGSGSGSSKSSTSGSSSNKSTSSGTSTAAKSGGGSTTSGTSSGSGGDSSSNSGSKSGTKTSTTTKNNKNKTNSFQSVVLDKNKKKTTFATGGYTGEWNDNEGRLAFLHQKELVLNENDTSNMLDSVYILRSIVDSLNGNIYDRLSGIRNFSGFSSGGDGLEQNVHIDATFPNVNSKKQIEEAFSELVNLAAQRAMRR